MDPFSITVGVASLIALVAQTAKLTQRWYTGAKEASKVAASLAKELEVLQAVLIRLDYFLKEDEAASSQPFKNTSVLTSSISACQARLKILHAKLAEVDSSKLDRLLWPLSEKQHKETIAELKTFALWIQLALSVDGWYVFLAPTSATICYLTRSSDKFVSEVCYSQRPPRM